MHYNGPIVRPPHEAYSVMLETTVGCTHNSCRFCTFYKDVPFHMAPLNQIEEDLKEVSRINPNVPRVWASGGDPFTMTTSKIETLAKLIKKYLPSANIAMYARVDSLFNKTVEDISYLRSLGVNDIVIGIENGDNETLSFMNKGYTAEQIITELGKLEEGGMDYRIIYLAGIAGHRRWKEAAEKSAELINRLHPTFMYLTSLTIQEDSDLYQDVQSGKFEPETEFDIICEFRTLVAGLNNPIGIDGRAAYNPVHFYGAFPRDKEIIFSELDAMIDQYTEKKEQQLIRQRARFTNV